MTPYSRTLYSNNSIFLDFASHLRTASSPHIVAQPTSKNFKIVYEDVLEFANTPEVRQNQQSSLAKKEAQPTFNSISNISDNCTVLPPYQSSIELSASALRALFDIVDIKMDVGIGDITMGELDKYKNKLNVVATTPVFHSTLFQVAGGKRFAYQVDHFWHNNLRILY
ncbi:hypothetical protein TYRP_016214 [Tyrophagus putrescentiae]|nr:hypothetical protein TYRP_016214 [Tyrophagus putrescentiae]